MLFGNDKTQALFQWQLLCFYFYNLFETSLSLFKIHTRDNKTWNLKRTVDCYSASLGLKPSIDAEVNCETKQQKLEMMTVYSPILSGYKSRFVNLWPEHRIFIVCVCGCKKLLVHLRDSDSVASQKLSCSFCMTTLYLWCILGEKRRQLRRRGGGLQAVTEPVKRE